MRQVATRYPGATSQTDPLIAALANSFTSDYFRHPSSAGPVASPPPLAEPCEFAHTAGTVQPAEAPASSGANFHSLVEQEGNVVTAREFRKKQ